MTRYYPDNIVAIATAPQNGAIGIIRLSGPQVLKILSGLFKRPTFTPDAPFKARQLYYGHICRQDGEKLDESMAVFMPGPRSFTGEDIVELHCHGNLHLMKAIVREILVLGSKFEIRGAEPGEFSKRAYLNSRIDLAQAESINSLIHADTIEASRRALSNLDGKLSDIVQGIKKKLVEVLAQIEASFEFAEEDIQTYDFVKVLDVITEIKGQLLDLKKAHFTSRLYDHGINVCIIGKPNVGKSTLLNALLVEERSIVTEISGTTRDIVEGTRVFEGIRFSFSDTAGLRETEDKVEQIGIERSKQKVLQADVIILVSDQAEGDSFGDLAMALNLPADSDHKIIKVLNKVDLIRDAAALQTHHTGWCFLSARDGVGIASLEKQLIKTINVTNSVHNNLQINERQFVKIELVLEMIEQILDIKSDKIGDEILAEEMRATIDLIEEITGHIGNEAVLSEIFSRFCIGK